MDKVDTPEESEKALRELKGQINYINCLISQDVFDFKCEGTVHPKHSTTTLERFISLLKEYSELQKEFTRRWQKHSGYLKG